MTYPSTPTQHPGGGPTGRGPVGAAHTELYADGIPLGSRQTVDPYSPPDPAPVGVVASAVKAASRIRNFEGVRGYSLRVSVWARHLTYFFSVILCCAVTHWAFSNQPAWGFGGQLQLFTVAYMAAVACVGSVLYAESRMKIAETFRQFTFGIVALPGTGIAVMSRILSGALDYQAAQNDQFLAMLTGQGVALLFFATVVIPAAVFTKYVFGGVRAAHRAGLTDTEAIAIYTRSDGLQR